MAPTNWSTLRRELHARAEVAFSEENTAAWVLEHLQRMGMDIVATDVGGTGILARCGTGGKQILLRAELDALPMAEQTGLDHAASGAHHACGHDGHMVMLLAALEQLAPAPPCTIWVLFQPAEETGEGMQACLSHPRVPSNMDAAIAMHNIPGEPMGSLWMAARTAAVASTGITLDWLGQTSHAAEPEAGRNPIPLAAMMVDRILQSPGDGDEQANAALVEIRGGGPRFGTNAGDCRLSATLRAGSDEALERMIAGIEDAARQDAEHAGIQFTLKRMEPFPATANDADTATTIRAHLASAGFDVREGPTYAWSEDFGYALQRWSGVLIGIGSGTEQPPLHSPAYDFPDELIAPGANAWRAIVEALA